MSASGKRRRGQGRASDLHSPARSCESLSRSNPPAVAVDTCPGVTRHVPEDALRRNTAFLDKSADLRMMFFAENGFPMSEFVRSTLGPVILRDEIEYYKEVGLLQDLTVTLAVAGVSEDGSRWLMRNEFLRPDGKLAARVTSEGGWLDLKARKLVAPPAGLLQALESLPRTDDFEALPTRVK